MDQLNSVIEEKNTKLETGPVGNAVEVVVKNPETSVVVISYNLICHSLSIVLFWELLRTFYHEFKSGSQNVVSMESLLFSFIIIGIPLIVLIIMCTLVTGGLKRNLFVSNDSSPAVKIWNRFVLFLLAGSVALIIYSLFSILANGDANAPWLLLPLFVVGGGILIFLSLILLFVNRRK